MRVLIIGASKGIGLETTRQALVAGYDVRALARSAAAIGLSHPKLQKVRDDALKSQNVKSALIGVEVVVQTLGVGLGELFQPVRLFSDATRVLIDAMTTQGVKRLICVTGFGAGDSRASIPWLLRLPFEARLWPRLCRQEPTGAFDPAERTRLDDRPSGDFDEWAPHWTI